MRKRVLQVTLRANEASVIDLTVGERVQLDRLIPSPRGTLAKRHGNLLGPGNATIALEPGHYFFKTLSDTNLRVITGGVTSYISANSKDPLPPIHPSVTASPVIDPPVIAPPAAKGDEGTGELPILTIE